MTIKQWSWDKRRTLNTAETGTAALVNATQLSHACGAGVSLGGVTG